MYLFKRGTIVVEGIGVMAEIVEVFATTEAHARLATHYRGISDYDLMGVSAVVDTTTKGIEWDSILVPGRIQRN